jgi:hypothetical protein
LAAFEGNRRRKLLEHGREAAGSQRLRSVENVALEHASDPRPRRRDQCRPDRA